MPRRCDFLIGDRDTAFTIQGGSTCWLLARCDSECLSLEVRRSRLLHCSPAVRRTNRPNTGPTNNSDNEGTGETIVIGFSGPAADHGWLGAINSAAIAEAAKYPDIELKVAEGTNDANLQISQVEGFINDKVDAIVLLPTDGAALTDVAIKAMEAGIPVINVDREFSSTFAARVTILGDNYGMGVSAGTYICEQLGGQPGRHRRRDRRHRLPAAHAGPSARLR